MKRFSLMVALLVLPSVAAADIVELKTGRRVEGTFKGADEAAVRIEVRGQLLAFKPEKVRAFYYGDTLGASTSKPTAGEEALRILKELQAITAARPTYEQYTGQVAHAKFSINVLLPKLTDGAMRSAVLASVHFFSAAGDAWRVMLRAKAGDSPDRERAEDVRAVIRTSHNDCAALTRLQPASRDDVIDGAVPAAWSCASDKIAEVEKLLGGG